MIALFAVLGALAALESTASAAIKTTSVVEASPQALTTERAAVLDPGLLNPHRARWALKRETILEGLEAIPLKRGFGARAAELRSHIIFSLRDPGPWYRPIEDYPCATRNTVFATREGTELAAQAALKSWSRMLDAETPRLERLIAQVVSPTPGTALKKSNDLFEFWLRQVELKWRDSGPAQALNEEWKLYARQAVSEKICSTAKKNVSRASGTKDELQKGASPRGPLAWESAMEPLPPAIALGNPMARGPSQRWAGLYSVRLNVIIAGRKLNGRFLIDTGIGRSVVSPEWLENQGIIGAWIAVPGESLVRIPWGAAETGEKGGLAPPVRVDQVEMGNTPLALRDFALYESIFFDAPEATGTCCDGVLGTDFLREAVVEFRPGPPAEVNLWAPAGFSLPEAEYDWFEVSLTDVGEAQSSCSAQSTSAQVSGVRWDTGRESALDIHLPWQGFARRATQSWRLSCGPNAELALASNVTASFPPTRGPESVQVREKFPGVSVGIGILGRSRFYLDLPHGRIWFPKNVGQIPIRANRSGLTLQYGMRPRGMTEDRVLLVDAIRPELASVPGAREALRKLVQQGLTRGREITLINQDGVGGFNQWEINQKLAGADADALLIQWRMPQGLRLGRLPVR